MDTTKFELMQQQMVQLCHWTCKLLFPVAKDDGTGAPSLVDLVPLMSKDIREETQLQASQQYPRGTRFKFPDSYRGPESQDALTHALFHAAHSCGFNLCINRTGTYSTGTRLLRICLCCNRAVPYSRQKKKHQKTFEAGRVAAVGVGKIDESLAIIVRRWHLRNIPV